MKKLKKSALVFLSFLILFLVGTFIFHRISLEKEQASLTPMGKTVLVNGYKINVYVEGDGPETIVVLSGAGIASPILDFKNISDSLSKKYKVVIRTSMNLNYNPRLEYIQVAEDAELYDFFAAVVEAVFEAEKPGLESRRQLVPRVPGAAEISPTTPVAMGEPPSLGYPPRRGMKQAKKLGAIEYVAGKNTR